LVKIWCHDALKVKPLDTLHLRCVLHVLMFCCL